MDAKIKSAKNYCEKNVRISRATHKELYAYTDRNPVFKLNKLADIAIANFLGLSEKGKVAIIMKAEQQEIAQS